MIWTRYNHIFQSEKFGTLLYNSLRNTFLNIGDDVYNEIVKIKSNPRNYDYNSNLKLKELLLEAGVIYDGADDDIKNQIKLDSSVIKYNKDFCNLTIIPTLDCNFRCVYCYEREQIKPIYMDDETENKIVDFISRYYKGAKFLSIAWFGGEPLLTYERIISITEKIKRIGIDFKSELITNGYLLSMDKIQLLNELNIDSVQITIDGTEETHNKRRPHFKNRDTYGVILSNIESILSYSRSNNQSFQINIRVNIDKENRNEYPLVYQTLKKKFPELYIRPGIIQGETTPRSCKPWPCALKSKDVAMFYLEQSQHSDNVDLDYYPEWSGITNCTATRPNDYVIGPRGEIYPCWINVGDNNMVIGNIHDEKVITNTTLMARFIEGIDPFEDEKCKDCFYLPICGGGCPYDRVLNKYYNQSIDTCIMHKGKKVLERMLEIHYEIKLKHQSQKIEKVAL